MRRASSKAVRLHLPKYRTSACVAPSFFRCPGHQFAVAPVFAASRLCARACVHECLLTCAALMCAWAACYHVRARRCRDRLFLFMAPLCSPCALVAATGVTSLWPPVSSLPRSLVATTVAVIRAAMIAGIVAVVVVAPSCCLCALVAATGVASPRTPLSSLHRHLVAKAAAVIRDVMIVGVVAVVVEKWSGAVVWSLVACGVVCLVVRVMSCGAAPPVVSPFSPPGS